MVRTREIPAASCVFAVLDAPASPGRDARKELLFQFETFLPQPLNSIHAVFVPLGDGRVLGCGCEREQVAAHRAAAEVLVPDAIPDWVAVDDAEAVRQRINLLNGAFRARSLIDRRRATAKLVCFLCLLVGCVLVIGVSRRVRSLGVYEAAVHAEMDEVYRTLLPPASGSAQPDAIRFATMLNQARATRTGVSPGNDREDLVLDLSRILEGWPAEPGLQVQSLRVGPGAPRLMMRVPDNDAAARVIAAIGAYDDWQVANRSLTPRSEGVELDMSLAKRSAGVTP